MMKYIRSMQEKPVVFWSVIGGIIVVALAIIIGVHIHRHAVRMAALQQSLATNQSVENALVPTEDVSRGSIHSSPRHAIPATPVLTYDEAVNTYADHRIQFDEVCSSTPMAPTFKSPVDLMLDNRSDHDRMFHLGTLGDVSIKAWSFKIVKFATTSLPMSVLIDCGASQNAATVLLQ